MIRSLREAGVLWRRNMLKLTRVPMLLFFSLFQPLLFLLLFSQVFSRLSEMPGFGYENYLQFLVPTVVALRTGNAELTMLIGILITFPVLFLSTGFMPQALLPDWLGTAAQFNPITYLIDALRALVNEGWNWTAIWQALAVTMGLASLTLTAATRAFRKVIS